MKLEHLAAILHAAATKAAELAAQEAAEAPDREAARREQVEADVEAVVAVVLHRPGVPTRELRAALGLAGLSLDRAQRAVDAALHAGRVVTELGPRRAQTFYLPTDIPKS